MDMQYSNTLCYNPFPFPHVSNTRIEEITRSAIRILESRERHSEKTLAQLYAPEKMPNELKEAHKLNDLAVEKCYRIVPFDSDKQRLEFLFRLYEKMIAAEKERNTLFEKQKKSRKRKKKNA